MPAILDQPHDVGLVVAGDDDGDDGGGVGVAHVGAAIEESSSSWRSFFLLGIEYFLSLILSIS